MEEYALGLIKPDGMKYYQQMLAIIKNKGLMVICQKVVHLDQQSIEQVYKENVNEDFFQSFCDFMTSGKCLVFVVKGKDTIKTLNKLVGNTNPHKAKPGTLRCLFGSNVQRNAIHSTKSEKHFKKEFRIFFPEINLEELLK